MNLASKINQSSFVVYDLETTGFGEKSKIIEFAGVRLEKWKPVASFHTLIQPEQKMHPALQNIHQISSKELEKAPPFQKICDGIGHFIQDAVLVGHNIFSFDSRFLSRQFIEVYGQSPDNWSIDTFVLSKKLLSLEQYKLGALAKELNVPLVEHHAMSDVYATTEIFFHLVQKMLELGLSHLEDFGRFQSLRKMKGSGLPYFSEKPHVTLVPR